MSKADWFGKTRLADKEEREPPKYLRRKLGEQILDEDALKAKDLKYNGSFQEVLCTVHYWQLLKYDEDTYAYIGVSNNGAIMMGWGDRIRPPDNL